jgi:hypothetical protein
MQAPGRNFLLATGIFYIIFGVIEFIAGMIIYAVGEALDGFLNTFLGDLGMAFGLGPAPTIFGFGIGTTGLVFAVMGVFYFVIGIMGIVYRNILEKAQTLMTLGIIALIFDVVSVLVTGTFSITTMPLFAIPICYIAGAYKNKNHAMIPPPRPVAANPIFSESQFSSPVNIMPMPVLENINVETFIKRIFLCIEEEAYDEAEHLINQVLYVDPENPKAYVAKLLVEYGLTEEAMLCDCGENLSENLSFKRAIRFADENYKQVLLGYAEANRKNRSKRTETDRKNDILRRAQTMAATVNGLQDAIDFLEKENDFEYANGLIGEYKNRQSLAYNRAEILLAGEDYVNARDTFLALGNYKDAKEKAQEIEKIAIEQKEHEAKINVIIWIAIIVVVIIMVVIATIAS